MSVATLSSNKGTRAGAGKRSLLSRGWLLVILLAVVVAAVAVPWQQFASFGHPPKVEEPVVVSKERFVHALGRLEPTSRVLRLGAPSGNEGARVEKLLAVEGDWVEKDAVLCRLDNFARRQAAVSEAETRLNAAVAKLEVVKAGAKAGDISARAAEVDILEKNTEFALKELERGRQLRASNVLPVEELEKKEWAYNKLILDRARAVHVLESIREVRQVDIAVAEAEVASMRAALDRARADLAASEVRAPRFGQVLRIHARDGERLGDSGLLELADSLDMQAVAEVFEGDLLEVQVGQPADIRLDSSGLTLQGTVASLGYIVARKSVLSNDPVSDTDARVVEVRVNLSSEDSKKVSRLSQARIEVQIHVTPKETLDSVQPLANSP